MNGQVCCAYEILLRVYRADIPKSTPPSTSWGTFPDRAGGGAPCSAARHVGHEKATRGFVTNWGHASKQDHDVFVTTHRESGSHIGKMTNRPVSHYARVLRSALPEEAFAPARSRLWWLPAHMGLIAVAFVAIARGWLPWPLLPLVSLGIGVCFAGLTFVGHEALHGAVVRDATLRRIVGFIGFMHFAISPKLWSAWHNRVHHGHANSPGEDPDAYPTLEEYRTDRKVRFVTDYLAPGRRRLIGLIALPVGFTVQSAQILLIARKRGYLNAHGQRVAIAESMLAVLLWTALAFVLGPLGFLFAFVLPLVVANVIVMAFIFTNHSLSPLHEVNDPLVNSLSVTLPRWAEWLTLRFGFHVEHHLFPGMSSRHAPLVRAAVMERWPERYQSMSLGRALLLLHRSGRIYEDRTRLLDPHTGVSTPALLPRLPASA
jgi:fatty acid desaturase